MVRKKNARSPWATPVAVKVIGAPGTTAVTPSPNTTGGGDTGIGDDESALQASSASRGSIRCKGASRDDVCQRRRVLHPIDSNATERLNGVCA
jgi:hypothetical protein